MEPYNSNSIYYEEKATVTDIEVWLNVSNRTARRRMAEAKIKLGIPKYEKPTREMLKRYFRIESK